MSTICFDIKRKDENYLCIQHAELNKFEYSTHLPFFFWAKSENNWYDETETERFVYLLVGKDEKYNGIERILFACNDKNDCDNKITEIENCYDLREIKLPLWKISHKYVPELNREITFSNENDMMDRILLYCPEKKVSLCEAHKYFP